MKGQHLRFTYLVFRIALFVLLVSHSTAQVVTVKDNQGTTLPGVEVFSQDLTIGLVTDDKGEVELSNVDPDVRIFFRYLGYEDRSLLIGEIAQLDYQLVLTLSDQLIEEVVVLGRKSINQSEIPFQIETISIEDIQSTNPQTSADALDQHGGVFVQKSQMGGGSPVIRGFEANRVLLVVDGIRLNNAIYRSGHLQNAVTVDQAMLEEMEVIFGPNSLMYGSDALGGVVSFTTRDPILSINSDEVHSSSNFYARYSSANNERSVHYDYSFGKRKWGSLTSITYSDFGDLRTGGSGNIKYPGYGEREEYQGIGSNGEDIVIQNENPLLQIGTAYNQFDILQKLLFTPDTDHRLSLNIQYSTSSDVPRYDNLSEYRNGNLRWAEWYYGPQNRLLVSADYRHIGSTRLYDQLVLIGAFQKIDEDRISRLFGNPFRNHQEEDVGVYSFTADASKYLDKSNRWRLDYGADIQYNDVNSQAFDEHRETGQIDQSVLTRYASGGNHLTNYGAYLYVSGRNATEKLRYNAGVRFAGTSYSLLYDRSDPVTWPTSFYDGISGSNRSLTWSIGTNWSISENWRLRGMLSTAFRSPNIDDLSKVRINAGEITFPNVDLQPEKSTNVELTIGSENHAYFNFSLTGFYTRLNDAIVRRPFISPDGSAVWENRGEILNVVGNQNIRSGTITGLSSTIYGTISPAMEWNASINYTRGRQIEGSGEETPLAHIPPVYGKMQLSFDKGNWNIRGVYRYNFSKDISLFGGSEDNPELATVDGALGWQTLNFYTTYEWSEIEFSLGLENLFDVHYRLFSSGVSAPGRNVILSVRGRF